MLLAIDTSTGTSVAVVDSDRGVATERTSHNAMGHAEVVGAMIRDVLHEAAVTPDDLDGVVCGMGPGPFTGLRIGIAAARVFALASHQPLLPIASHDGIAFAEYAAGRSPTEAILVETDARRREVFWSAYSGADNGFLPRRSEGPNLATPSGLDDLRRGIRETRVVASGVSALALGRCAEGLILAGRAFLADEPLYLRSPDVTLSTTVKRVTA